MPMIIRTYYQCKKVFPSSKIIVATDDKRIKKVCEKESPDAVIFVQALGVPHHKERLLALKEKYNFLSFI